MKKSILFLLFLIGVSVMHGCSYMLPGWNIDRNCPTPKDQVDEYGYLLLQKGVTLKCQVKNYTHRMDCIGVVDSAGVDGLICDSGKRKALFLFDENGILKDHRIW